MRGTIVILLFLAPFLGGCRLVGTPPPAPPSPATTPNRPDPAASEGERIAAGVVDTALQALGTPYRWGGTASNGFDCSGLIQYAYAQHGIDLPRRSQDQLGAGRPVETRLGALQPADILGFAETAGGKSSHVGLYVGGGDFIHSSSTGVRLSELTDPFWQVRLLSARRIVR